MNLRMTIMAGLLSLMGACAQIEPVGGGAIRFRCGADGGPTITRPCGPEQTPICVTDADAGNGNTVGVCCDPSETREACLRSAFPDAAR